MPKESILCCDDDQNILSGFLRNLRKQFHLVTATSGEQALQLMEQSGPFAVVVADMQMPGMNGVQLLTKIEARWPETIRIMLTGNAGQQTAVDAVNQGHVFRFLTKPCPAEALALALEAGLRQYQLVRSEKELLENTLNSAVRVLCEILAVADPSASGRGRILRDQMRMFLESLDQACRWDFEMAAMLSPIGYVTIPANVLERLNGGQTLSAAEKTMINHVPRTGSELIAKIPRLEGVAEFILYQNKNYDGTGFPEDDRHGEDIPLASRILRVLGAIVTMEARGLAKGEALLAMQQQAGCYDPRVLDAAFKCFDAYLPTASTTVATNKAAVNIEELHPGMVLLSDIETESGMLLIPHGGKLTPVMLEKIRNFALVVGVRQPIYVAPAQAGNEVDMAKQVALA
ncbi:MAG TPA: HD domain-containing phosphohydrolase [Verrucomicrobiae bacterium]